MATASSAATAAADWGRSWPRAGWRRRRQARRRRRGRGGWWSGGRRRPRGRRPCPSGPHLPGQHGRAGRSYICQHDGSKTCWRARRGVGDAGRLHGRARGAHRARRRIELDEHSDGGNPRGGDAAAGAAAGTAAGNRTPVPAGAVAGRDAQPAVEHVSLEGNLRVDK